MSFKSTIILSYRNEVDFSAAVEITVNHIALILRRPAVAQNDNAVLDTLQVLFFILIDSIENRMDY